MTPDQVQLLQKNGRFPGATGAVELIETHISWLLLTPEFAFKIKKPVKFHFLDFSTPEKRALCCEAEVWLNRRLALEMYLGVFPIRLGPNNQPEIGEAGENEDTIDHAVWMKKMDNSRQMDLLLRKNAVSAADMSDMAQLLVRFHKSVVMPAENAPYRPDGNQTDFEDLFQWKEQAVKIVGPSAATVLDDWQQSVEKFLARHEARFEERVHSGFWVDGHGDLHARNIFLLPQGPVVFDCIEFNAHFRQLDVLNELAFLCMDLEAGGRQDLAEIFMNDYCRLWPCIEHAEDEQLFLYFKAYRANVRLKVVLMEIAEQQTTDLEKTARVYWGLLEKYLAQLIASSDPDK